MHYNTMRYHRRVAEMHRLLGGECVACGATAPLNLHHRDPKKKGFDPKMEFDRPWKQIVAELKKCELLCVPCHKAAHPAQHGLSRYRWYKCRCDVCVTTWNAACKRYKATAKAKRLAQK